MYLRCHSRKKNGKGHRYWSVVESRRCRQGTPAQRQVLYLSEINDSQEAAWRKTIAVFDEQKQQYQQLSLFPSDRPLPPDELNVVAIVHEVPRPDVVLVLRSMPNDALLAAAQPPLFVLFLRHLEALLLPQAPHALAVHPPTLAAQHGPDPPVTVARMNPHPFVHPLEQRRLVAANLCLVALGRPRLPDHTARLPL
jgi:hypothetical protein